MTMKTTEERLRGALSAAGDTVTDIRPLTVPVHRRSRAPLRIGAALAAAVVAFGIVRISAPVQPPENETLVAMAVNGIEPSEEPLVTVFLCQSHSPFPPCAGRGGSTAAEKEDLRRRLLASPEVEAVTFRDRKTAWEKFRRENADKTVLLSVIKVDDMPESFWARVRPGADPMAVVRAVGRLPGVSHAVDQRCAQEQWERSSLRARIARVLPWSDDDRRQCSFPEAPDFGKENGSGGAEPQGDDRSGD
ncbi:permease-like cell division protein FtsX [Streptosporangium sp. NPDC048047]|uniref:permease-like cell division protein FtsX n=1 Tax=Streptosporangium sp. NPDC048047 TaxID=3155748 RepID=UPI0034220369